MFQRTASTTQTDSTSKTPTKGLLSKIREVKGLPALAFLGTLMVACVILLVALLMYVLFGASEPAPLVSSLASMTPDEEDNTTTTVSTGKGSHKTTSLSNTTAKGTSKVTGTKKPGPATAKKPGTSATVHAHPRHHQEHSRRLYNAFLPGYSAESDTTTALNESALRSEVRAPTSSSGVAGQQKVARDSINHLFSHRLTTMSGAQTGLKESSGIYLSSGPTTDDYAVNTNSSKHSPTAITAAQKAHNRIDHIMPLPDLRVSPDVSPISHANGAEGQAQLESTAASIEKKLLLNYIAPSVINADYDARTEVLTNTSRLQPLAKFAMKGSRDAAPSDNFVTDRKYAIDFDDSESEDNVSYVAPVLSDE
ncbi:hypothetical protein V5799_011547 [Amblyomma americanum]|uniref:Uncharacterized protein n=1 Tax=Amblyomma americanum TaxID=6943 RepID=A0AAQ4EGX8_AMBAM